MSSPDHTLAAERTYLRRARDHLGRMREHTMSLTAQAGDAVSQAYLEAALHRRARALEDDPDVPLFFGRIDRSDELFYIGRRHVMDEAGDPVVIDWRADISRAFYRATRTDPYGLVLRRRYGFDRGELTSYEDEHLTDPTEADVASRILADEIERRRNGKPLDQIAIKADLPPYCNVRPSGEDVHRGQLVLEAGTVVRPAEIGVLAAVGLQKAAVIRRPIVSILSTGDELVSIGQPLGPGKIHDSNSSSIAASVMAAGGIPRLLGIARDNLEDLRRQLVAAGNWLPERVRGQTVSAHPWSGDHGTLDT
jgi:hypothetical protein